MAPIIKMLHLLNNFEDKSNNRLVLDLVNGLESNKYCFHVGCAESAGGVLQEEFSRAGVNAINFDMKGYFDFSVINRIRNYIKNYEIDVVHTHGLRVDFLGWLAVWLEVTPLLVATKHNLNFVPGQTGWLWKNILYRLVLAFPDLVITVSENLRESLIKIYGLQPRKVITIHNGINLESFHAPQTVCHYVLALRKKWGLLEGDFVVCFTGRLVKEKGLIYLLHAIRSVLSLYKNCYLLIVGNGPLLGYLKRKAKDLGIEKHVIFTGHQSDIPNILAGIDVLVLPSLTEGLPLSVMEAMAAGKAVISTPVGGVRELIQPEETGLLVPVKNPEALSDAIAFLIKNEQKRSALGVKARVLIKRNYGLETMLKKYDMAYQKVISTRM
jgi:glycosyltransferase involved in cell wall biosynthesis